MENYERNIFMKALSKWGQRNQLDQANEEMNELCIELHKIRRGRNTDLVDLAGEVADVSIMIDQIRVCFGGEFENLVNSIRNKKIARLIDRVNDINHKGN